MLSRDSEIVICSRFVNGELWSCDMNSTLWSVVRLAMFLLVVEVLYIREYPSQTGSTRQNPISLLMGFFPYLIEGQKFQFLRTRSCLNLDFIECWYLGLVFQIYLFPHCSQCWKFVEIIQGLSETVNYGQFAPLVLEMKASNTWTAPAIATASTT